jgi:parallel beta-helix repeat protein
MTPSPETPTVMAIEYAQIRYAGEWRGDRYGAIHLEGASPTITNNTIENSFAYGIWHDANSSPQLSDNTFNNNAEGDVVAAQ